MSIGITVNFKKKRLCLLFKITLASSHLYPPKIIHSEMNGASIPYKEITKHR